MSSALDFLTELVDEGAHYSTVNTARCALSSLLWTDDHKSGTFGNHPLVVRFMRGVYNLRPLLPRYSSTWDVSPVLRYISSLEPLNEITLKQLSHKLVSLCALTTGQRAQTLSLLNLRNINIIDGVVKFNITELVKTSKANKQQPTVILSMYSPDKTLCVVRTLLEYIKRTKYIRKDNLKLFLSYVPPHGEVGVETICRWLKQSLVSSGIDVSVFKAHSFRSASTSAAASKGLPVNIILETAGWSNAKTFATFYNRSQNKEIPQTVFASTVLGSK